MNFIKKFESKVKKEANKLFNKNEKILIAVSGGKDSTTILYLLKKWGYDVEALIINLGFKHFKEHINNVKELCFKLKINLHIVDVKKELNVSVRKLQLSSKKSNCFTCGIVKRYLINKKMKELGYNKIVTGHNLTDYAESILMNIIMNNHKACLNLFKSNRIKPLNYISEKDIEKYSKLMKFNINYSPCPYSSNAFRRDILNILDDFKINELNIVKFFERLKPLILSKFKRNKLKKCKVCGELSNTDVCRVCKLLT